MRHKPLTADEARNLLGKGEQVWDADGCEWIAFFEARRFDRGMYSCYDRTRFGWLDATCIGEPLLHEAPMEDAAPFTSVDPKGLAIEWEE